MVNKANTEYHPRKLKHFVSKTKDAPIFAIAAAKQKAESESSTHITSELGYEQELVAIWREKLLNKALAEVLML